MEILRDVAAQHNISMADLNRFVTVHEIGHQFGLTHTSGLHVMAIPGSDAEEALVPTIPIKFSDGDLVKIREDVPKKDPYHP